MDHIFEEKFKTECRIDFKKYRKNPTEHETTKIFNYLINKILMVDPPVDRLAPEMYRIVNGLLERLESSVKVYPSEFLVPTTSTVMAVRILGMYFCKRQALTTGENNIITTINAAQAKVGELLHLEMNVKQMRELFANSDNEIAEVDSHSQHADSQLQTEQQVYEEEHDQLKKQLDMLKQVKNENDLLDVHLQTSQHKSTIVDAQIAEETELFRKLCTIASKEQELEQLESKCKSEISIKKPVTEALDVHIVPNLKALNNNLSEVINSFAENSISADNYFETQKKVSKIQKQIDELQGIAANHKQHGKEIICEIERISTENDQIKSELNKKRRNIGNMYLQLKHINNDTRHLEKVTEQNNDVFHSANETFTASLRK